MGDFEFSISPERHNLPILGDVSSSVITAWIIMAVIIIFGLIFRFIIVHRFKPLPKGFQNIMELFVSSVYNFSKNYLGKYTDGLAAYIFTIPVFMIGCCVLELIGIRPPTTDISQTAALALLTFVLINVYGIRKKGIWGRIKSLASPNPVMLPINLIIEVSKPVSLACRMFGNMLGGLIVMELLYVAFAYIIPGIMSIYFTVFHVIVQTLVFMMLSLTFINEAME